MVRRSLSAIVFGLPAVATLAGNRDGLRDFIAGPSGMRTNGAAGLPASGVAMEMHE